MAITFKTTLSSSKIHIQLENEQVDLFVTSEVPELPDHAFYLFFQQKNWVAVGKTILPKKFDTVVMVQLPWEMDAEHLIHLFSEHAKETGKTIETDKNALTSVPAHVQKNVTDIYEKITEILTVFGYFGQTQTPEKKKPAKARHRWSKEVSEIPFTVDFRGSTATIYWIKRNEMLIKAGASLMPEAPLNKDGSLGYAAKYGEKLRADHQEKISGSKTIEDIIVKSVNEASLLLYFGGTNSWLEFTDENGKTIDEWTRVE
ncbi:MULTISPECIES: hypothetical protein [unclassified Enterococcus]|jgi:hypothetical protein|uniref:hypothetical protein n=1 Tax=unclassified Enterococcus TaxID=2608891 RepID=UPI003D2D8B75